MYRNVLIATDGSELAQKAVDHGVAMAQAINAKVTVVTVSEPFHAFAVQPRMVTDTREQYEQHVAACAAEYLAAAKKAASAAGVTCDTVHVQYPHPHQGIIDTATQKGCDLIVMASHGRRGISAVVLGSETVKVLTHSAIPVLVVRPSQPAASLGQETPSARPAAAYAAAPPSPRSYSAFDGDGLGMPAFSSQPRSRAEVPMRNRAASPGCADGKNSNRGVLRPAHSPGGSHATYITRSAVRA